VPHTTTGIKFNIFGPERNMPNISEVGDVILIRQAKVCNVSLSFKKFVILYPAGRNMEWLRLSAKPLGDRVSYSP